MACPGVLRPARKKNARRCGGQGLAKCAGRTALLLPNPYLITHFVRLRMIEKAAPTRFFGSNGSAATGKKPGNYALELANGE